MRKFYVFQIKKEYETLYETYPKNLYDILESLFLLKEKNYAYGVELFFQLTDKIDKNRLNKEIFIQYHQERIYSKINTSHVINDLYKDEVSMLIVKKSYLLIESNHNHSTFFSFLKKKKIPFFICDFQNRDYFWLSDLKTLV